MPQLKMFDAAELATCMLCNEPSDTEGWCTECCNYVCPKCLTETGMRCCDG